LWQFAFAIGGDDCQQLLLVFRFRVQCRPAGQAEAAPVERLEQVVRYVGFGFVDLVDEQDGVLRWLVGASLGAGERKGDRVRDCVGRAESL
jgi:hypothetical protein